MLNKIKKWGQILLPLVLGGITSLITMPTMDYEQLIQPPLSPPKIVFPIAWTIFYFLIGLSYYLYTKDFKNRIKKTYIIHLILNYTWTLLFFTFKLRGLAIIWIISLIITLILIMREYYQTKRISFYMLIPYLIWLLFATYLNIGVYALN